MQPEETELNCDSGSLGPCMVWLGPDLAPRPCGGLRWEAGRLTDILPAPASLAARDLQWGVLPAFVNGHTHIGDCFLAEAAIPLTLEEAFFRPDGLKYRELERIPAAEHIAAMAEFQRGMAAAGCVAHLDFREQGVEGARRLRAASEASGVRSVILSQVDRIAFDAAALAENTAPIPPAMRAELAEILTVADGISESTMNDWTEPAWRELRTLAAGRNKATAIHCLESSTYRSVSLDRCGIGDLRRAVTELQPDVVVHLTVAEPEEIALLAAAGIPFQRHWLDPFHEFRFPRYGTTQIGHLRLELRFAIEPWNVLGEEATSSGTARYVDSSAERIQVRVQGMNDERHALTCNGRRVPLVPTGTRGDFVAGIRYQAWQPWSAMHPTLAPHTPLVFDLVDLWNGRSLGGCTYHVAHPGGRNYDTLPVNALEAEARRVSRFWQQGHTQEPASPVTFQEAPTGGGRSFTPRESQGRVQLVEEPVDPDFPCTFDLRRKLK